MCCFTTRGHPHSRWNKGRRYGAVYEAPVHGAAAAAAAAAWPYSVHNTRQGRANEYHGSKQLIYVYVAKGEVGEEYTSFDGGSAGCQAPHEAPPLLHLRQVQVGGCPARHPPHGPPGCGALQHKDGGQVQHAASIWAEPCQCPRRAGGTSIMHRHDARLRPRSPSSP